MRSLSWLCEPDFCRIAAACQGLSGGHGAGGDQLFPNGVDSEIEPLQGARAQQDQIARLGENHFIYREVLSDAHYGKTDAASHHFAIGHNEADILFLSAE